MDNPHYSFGNIQGVMKDATRFFMDFADRDSLLIEFDYKDKEGKQWHVRARGYRTEAVDEGQERFPKRAAGTAVEDGRSRAIEHSEVRPAQSNDKV
jgi:hypothetical protein